MMEFEGFKTSIIAAAFALPALMFDGHLTYFFPTAANGLD